LTPRRDFFRQAVALCGAYGGGYGGGYGGAFGGALSAATLAGCAFNPDQDHTGPDAPSAPPLPHVPRVAWVLSSGGPRGFVHVGVMKALDEINVAPDVIIGASAGALVGVLRAAGWRGAEMEAFALEVSPTSLARVAIGSRENLSGSAIAQLVREKIRDKGQQPLLEKLPLMVVCVAHRLGDDTTVPFCAGDAGLAVQAACAIEGQFTPVRVRGQRHVDADLHLPLPVRLARSLGATRVLAVDASAHETRAPPGTERWRASDLRKRALTQPDADKADVLVHPEFGYYASISREYRERCIVAGYRDTMAQAERIKALHAA
jgi:NTE family protein